MCTSKNAPKLPALRKNPAVALTIDTEVHPPKLLLVRGPAELDVVEGIPDEYLEAAGTEADRLRDDRSWTLSNSERCAAGGPERSWVTWSGGVAREGVPVFRRGRGCRESWRDPPSLRTRPARGRSGVALTARSSGRTRVTPAHLHALALSACYHRIALGHATVYEKSLSAEQFHTLPSAVEELAGQRDERQRAAAARAGCLRESAGKMSRWDVENPRAAPSPE